MIDLALFRRLPAALILAALTVIAAGCSGAVNPSPNVNDPLRITILPTNPVMYSGMPTTFSITGGSGSYIVVSDNQAVLPVSGVSGHTLTVAANPVLVDTTVTLTVRDTGIIPVPVTATVTVKPGTVNNDITVTPSSTQSASCNPALCSGGDALASVTISQGGIPLAATAVQFDVISGDFRLITTLPGVTPERLELTARVVTDQTGKAQIRLRALALAPNQTALLQVTDLASGAFQRSAFAIAQFTGSTPAFFAMPSSITFFGPSIGVCATSGAANVAIFGGSPPYTVVNSSNAFFLQAAGSIPSTSGAVVVFASGGVFNVSVAGQVCVTDAPVSITDSTGRTITITLNSKEGTTVAPPGPLQVVPASVTVGTCGGSASFVATGGKGTYFASSPDSRILVTVAGSTITVKRNAGDPPPDPALVNLTIAVTDGTSTVSVTAIVPRGCL